jgi:hypothetical protein
MVVAAAHDTFLPRQIPKCSGGFPESSRGRQPQHPHLTVISRPGPRAPSHNTLGWDRSDAVGKGHAIVKQSPLAACRSPRRQAFPTRDTHPLPSVATTIPRSLRGRAASFPECSAAASLAHPLLSRLLLLSYPSSPGRAGGREREGDPEPSACRVRRREGDGAGSTGENGRTKGRGVERGGEGK